MCVCVSFLMCVLCMCFVMCVCVGFVICVSMCGFYNVWVCMCVFFIYIYSVLHKNSDTTCSLTILMYTSFLHILGYYVSITLLGCQMRFNYQIFWKIYNVSLWGYFCCLASLLIWKLLSLSYVFVSKLFTFVKQVMCDLVNLPHGNVGEVISLKSTSTSLCCADPSALW
jgi:hypothetical protein